MPKVVNAALKSKVRANAWGKTKAKGLKAKAKTIKIWPGLENYVTHS